MIMRISIVVPLFNKGPYIEQALLALVRQLHPGDEIVVVDDRSTDDGPATARRVLESMPDAQVMEMEQNAGPASARNAGARAATGTHLLFFDADDIPSADLLTILRSAIKRFPAESVFSFGIAFEARGEAMHNEARDGRAQARRLPKHAFAEHSLAGQALCTASSTCVSRSAFLTAGGFQEGLRYCEDPELWVRLSANHPVVKIDDILAIYRDVPDSLSYGWRGRIGSVNPYVDSLIQLAEQHGNLYWRLAGSLVFKNLVFGKAAGSTRSEVVQQLRRYRKVLGSKKFTALLALNLLPSVAYRALVNQRTARLQRAASC